MMKGDITVNDISRIWRKNECLVCFSSSDLKLLFFGKCIWSTIKKMLSFWLNQKIYIFHRSQYNPVVAMCNNNLSVILKNFQSLKVETSLYSVGNIFFLYFFLLFLVSDTIAKSLSISSTIWKYGLKRISFHLLFFCKF